MINKFEIIYNSNTYTYNINLDESNIVGINNILLTILLIQGQYVYNFINNKITLNSNNLNNVVTTLYYNGIGYSTINNICNNISLDDFLNYGSIEFVSELNKLSYLILYTSLINNYFVNEIVNSDNDGYYGNFILKKVNNVGIEIVYLTQLLVGKKIKFNYLILN